MSEATAVPDARRRAAGPLPDRPPVLEMHWDKLLFLHWRIAANELRPRIPRPLKLDTLDGTAWIGITPFTMCGVRPKLLPPVPGLSASHELNVRTNVTFDGTPGVWFLSLDASNWAAVIGARTAFGLPYFWARQRTSDQNGSRQFASCRRHPGAAPAEFGATWTLGTRLPTAAPNSLAFFFVERYWLFTQRSEKVYGARINQAHGRCNKPNSVRSQ